MRSSIACMRCRRSKVKCVNTGPNTTCRACDSNDRECSYPQPVPTGVSRQTLPVMAINTVSAYSPHTDRQEAGLASLGAGGYAGRVSDHAPKSLQPQITAPKKSKAKKPTPNAGTTATAASLNTPAVWKECLSTSVLTQPIWQILFDAFQYNHSPMLPFLHPPTFLNRLRSSVSNPPPSSGSSPPPEKPHSPLVLLGMLALTARHVPEILSHYAPALSTPSEVSNFFASALKYRLKSDTDENLIVPCLDKVQALLMLSVHEWGQMHKSDAYMWLGIAIRMSAALGLSWMDIESASPSVSGLDIENHNFKRRKIDHGPPPPSKSTTAHTVEKEIRRRTFWAVFMVDRAFSTSRSFPSGLSVTYADQVQLPCEDRRFMFGNGAKTGFLNSEALSKGIGQSDEGELGAGERIVAHLIKAFELWQIIQSGCEIVESRPMDSGSKYHKFASALNAFVDFLPHQLVFSQETLQAHLSNHSSSAYAMLHIVLLLARITLEQQFLPPFPFRSTRPLGPEDTIQLRPTPEEARFYESSAERLHAAARDMISLIAWLDEWNSLIESPFVISALASAALVGLYAYNFPWMDRRGYLTGNSQIADTIPLGTGEESRKGLQYIIRLKSRWACAQDSLMTLSRMQTRLTENKDVFIHQESQEGAALLKRISRVLPNVGERIQLFSLLIPPTPKLEPLNDSSSSVHDNHDSNAEVDTLVLAGPAASSSEPQPPALNEKLGERWTAVNTQPTHSQALGQASVANSLRESSSFMDQTTPSTSYLLSPVP